MNTRIETDGFGSFQDFAPGVPPFPVLVGSGAGGESNLLDAVNFGATAATHGLDDVVAEVRGDACGLFRERGDGTRVTRPASPRRP